MTHSASAKVQSVAAAIAARGSVARRKDLLASGYTVWNLKQAVASAQIEPAGRGYFALPNADPLDLELAKHQARRTCLSKVASLGLWLLEEPAEVHVAAAHGRAIPGCVVHRVSGGQTLMSILRQCVKCGTVLEALIVLESAVVNGKCTINALRLEFSGREDTAARSIVSMIDPQSMAITETAARYHFLKAGYVVQCQVYIRDVGHLDLLVDGILGVEIDGEKYHNSAQAWEEDLRRDTMFVVNGVWRLRIPASVALYRPELMLRWVAQALAAIRSA